MIFDFGARYLEGYKKTFHRMLDLKQLHVTPQPMNQPSVELCAGEPEIPETKPWMTVDTSQYLETM